MLTKTSASGRNQDAVLRSFSLIGCPSRRSRELFVPLFLLKTVAVVRR
jgi:hypothetical protein